MEKIGLILELLKISLDIFQDSRKDRFTKQRSKLEKEWNDEKAKPIDEQSDLTFDRLLFESETLAREIIESYTKSK
jgi:hypothetical protein